MRQFHDIKTRNKQISDGQELETKPGPLVISNLTKNSLSDDFEEAKHEWEFAAYISSDSEEFVENCELCNHKNHVGNWLIFNPNTNKKMKLGSDCIKRFIILNGTGNQQDSNTFFAIKQSEIKKELQLLELYVSVIIDPLPLARNANKFKKLLLELLTSRGQIPMSTTIEGIRDILINILKRESFSEAEAQKLYILLNDTQKFVVQRENKRYREFIAKEGQTWQRRRKVTGTTLSKSRAYKPDTKYN